MKNTQSKTALPASVARALRKFGSDISVARRLRGISTALMAERAFIARNTLARAEKGDPGVSIGIYATLLFVLGLEDRLGDLADAAHDPIGRYLHDERLPKRIRRRTSAGLGDDRGA